MREPLPLGRTSLLAKKEKSLCGLPHGQHSLALLRERRALVDAVTSDPEDRLVILVIEDVEETRHGIERLLKASGYQVITARDEQEAVLTTSLHHPDLILMSLGLDVDQVLPVVARIREHAGLGEEVPFVVFCFTGIAEGAELAAGYSVYMTRPDNFDQLRALLSRLLGKLPRHG
jgi:CheY-like chemotaxis protein